MGRNRWFLPVASSIGSPNPSSALGATSRSETRYRSAMTALVVVDDDEEIACLGVA